MTRGLHRLDTESHDTAVALLLRCCGSRTWASEVAARRPYESVPHLHHTAAEVWWRLSESDWREAFAAHPRIGERAHDPAKAPTREWSDREQAGTASLTEDTDRRLADANETYYARFGFIFIICATGKSAPEMLAALESRIDNDPDDELKVAAREQMQITALRIDKLLAELELNE